MSSRGGFIVRCATAKHVEHQNAEEKKRGLSFLNIPYLSPPLNYSKSRKDYNFLQLSAKKKERTHALFSFSEAHCPQLLAIFCRLHRTKGLKELTQWEMWFDALISQPRSDSFNHCLTLQPHRLRISRQHLNATKHTDEHTHTHTHFVFPHLWRIYIYVLNSDVHITDVLPQSRLNTPDFFSPSDWK